MLCENLTIKFSCLFYGTDFIWKVFCWILLLLFSCIWCAAFALNSSNVFVADTHDKQ